MSKNSAEFAWSNTLVTIMGRTFERILAIEYDVEVEKKQIYGRGSKVKGIQRQNEKPTGSITVGQSEYEAMVRVAGGKVTDIVADIQVHYTEEDGTAIVKDRIIGAEFTKAQKGIKQGDADMEIKMDFIAMDILFNI